MGYSDLLNDSCTVMVRTVTPGKIATESFAAQANPIPCRVLKRSAVRGDEKKQRYVTVISARFTLLMSAEISIRDRIQHEGRAYDVVEIIVPRDATAAHHKIAVCEAMAGVV